MKIRHRIPFRERTSDMVDADYQAAVDRATARGELSYQQALRRLEAAERRAKRAQLLANLPTASPKRVEDAAVAWALFELRRVELMKYERIMLASPASAEHRGDRSFRPVPRPGRPF